MTCTVIKASPRGAKAGSSRAADAFIRGLKKEKVSVKEIILNQMSIKHCTGCYTCWTKTPGKCIHRDDMDTLLPLLAQSDLIVYATPLYTYSVPGRLKDFFDRCIPLSEPYLVESGKTTGHPGRTPKEQKMFIISTAGFPEKGHFTGMMEMFNHLTGSGKRLAGSILIPGAEMLANDSAQAGFSKLYGAIEEAGKDVAAQGGLSQHTEELLRVLENERLASAEQFREIANAYWKSLQPETEEKPDTEILIPAHGAVPCSLTKGGMECLMAGMAMGYNPTAVPGMTGVFQFNFDDDYYHLLIKDNACTAYRGKHPYPLFTVSAPQTVWEAVCEGTLDGTEGLMTGKYTVDGDLVSFMKMDSMFTTVEEEKAAVTNENSTAETNTVPGGKKSPGVLEGLSGGMQMTIAFIPWTLLWVLTPFWGAIEAWVLAAGFSAILGVYRIRKGFIPLFEGGSALFLVLHGVFVLYGGSVYASVSTIVQYLFLSGLWSASLARKHCLTAEYIQFDYPEAARKTRAFIETNRILTSAWSIYFMISAFMVTLPGLTDMPRVFDFAPYTLLFLMFIFTGWFQGWYPVRLMKKAQ